jgi:hypothetical protein
MKRLFALFIATVMLCTCAAVLASCVDDEPTQKLAYTVNEDNTTCTITGLGEYDSTDVEIPEIIDGYKVTGIGERAFFNCSTLTSITIKDNITGIGSDAFYGCSGLKGVYINDLKTWLNISFEDYWSNPCYPGGQLYLNGEPLSSITIPEGITSIGPFTFAGHSYLTGITIPDSVTSIGNHAFYGCESLTSVSLGRGVTSIARGTFFSCSSLTDITLPESVTSIESKAFSMCDGLTSVTLPGKLKSIGNMAFHGCKKLTSFKFTGTIVQWIEVSKGTNWHATVPATEIACSNGTAYLDEWILNN